MPTGYPERCGKDDDETQHKYSLVDGHVIVRDDEQRLLIDTGAPFSVGDTSTLAFAGGSYSMQSDYVRYLRIPEQGVGSRINALVGADILNRYDIFMNHYMELQPDRRRVSLIRSSSGIGQLHGHPDCRGDDRTGHRASVF